jgi:putative DNA methylase
VLSALIFELSFMLGAMDIEVKERSAVDTPRLIEYAFPLKQALLDSVHEKNVRHGHISTLHIWPARRSLAACRAALIATLLPDPGDAEERKKILERLGGKVVQVVKKKKLPSGKVEEQSVEETVGGILHWGRESGPDVEWFRQKIREACGGQAPKVLDPFAGGGAIPLEAIRLGCEVTASDINPVAWFILKCTLEYPQKLAGQRRPLPKFVLESREFTENYFKGTGKVTKKQLEQSLEAVQIGLFPPPDVDLAWHVRAWGWWVLQRAKADLERFYPVVDGKSTAAYLWARTVRCKNCRATIPLLKTRRLCKNDNKRTLVTMEPNADRTGAVFGIRTDVPQVEGNSAQRREHDKRLGGGTMSRSGVTCPCCSTIMTMEDIRLEGQAARLSAVMTAVVLDGSQGKEYRLLTDEEISLAPEAEKELERVFAEIPFGLPEEPLPSKEALGFRVPLYGFDQWHKLFTRRQLLALGTFVKHTRAARDAMHAEGYPSEWVEAVGRILGLSLIERQII